MWAVVGFGARLTAAREAAGLTQESMAVRLGVGSSTVSRWERELVLPQSEQLVGLAETLGASLDYLLRGLGTHNADTEVFRAFLATTLGQIAQERRYIEVLLSVRAPRASVGLYKAITAGLLMADDK